MATVYRWSRERFRYLDARGRVIPETTIRKAVEAFTRNAAESMRALTVRLQGGEIDVAEWRIAMATEIKMAHTAAAMIAHGGRDQMTRSDWGYAGRIVRDQYGFLRKFADALQRGELSMDDRIVRRAGMYAETARMTFEQVRDRDAKRAGFDQERNRLGGAEKHCKECPDLSGLGWVVLGSLPPIGTRQCKMGCRCIIERRRAPAALSEVA